MAFKISFKAGKPVRPANNNMHDEAAWLCAYDWAEKYVGYLPQQFAVHCIYEAVNQPWLPDKERIDNMFAWFQSCENAV